METFKDNIKATNGSIPLSIIIPAYNAAKDIDKCIRSIIAQTYSNFELIIVNDCSTDATKEILDSWSADDHRIKCIHLEKNGGVSRARNKGIAQATGEYVTFIDADDHIDSEYFEKALSDLSEFDLIVLGFKLVSRNNITERIPEEKKLQSIADIKEEYEHLDNERLLLGGPFNKFFRKSIIDINGITFPDFSLGEDQCFVLRFLFHIKDMKTVAYSGYNYIRHEGPSLARGVERSFEDVDQFLKLKFQLEKELFNKFNLPDLSLEAFSKRNLLSYMARIFSLYSIKYKIKSKQRRKFLKQLRKEPWADFYRESNYNLKYNSLKPFILYFPLNISDLMLAFFFKIYYNK